MLYPLTYKQTWNSYGGATEVMARQRASKLYERAWHRGWLRRFWLTLTGKSARLLELAEVHQTQKLQNGHYLGQRTVPLDQVQGSVDRAHDFDNAFYPRQEHTLERWLRVAMAYQAGINLPPVTLVQIGEVYYVEDGHHRLSVARAMGWPEIEAEVKVWRVSPK